MSEYRQDPLTGRTVIVAEERASRPHQFDIEETGSEEDQKNGYRSSCPFCEGNENLTPDEITVFRAEGTLPDTPGWTVRTIPNKYPAVARNAMDSLLDGSFVPHGGDFFVPIPGVGNHEVIVDTPRHVLSLSDMTEFETVDMFRMYRARLQALREENRWDYVQIFKNVGAAAGASIPHSHSQLIAMPFIPESQRMILLRAEEYHRDRSTVSKCIWCDILDREIREGVRVVEKTEFCVALCPFVSRFTAEVEVYPRKHRSRFEDLDDQTLADFARLVRRTIIRLEQAVSWMKGNLAYNLVLHTEPFRLPSDEMRNGFHCHLSILPSLARAAGFEWGTGLHINPIPPEKAAEQLRNADAEQNG